MARVEVHGATVQGGRIDALRVKLKGLPARTIDRPTAIAWMKDGHSLIAIARGQSATALQLVAVGDDDEPFIRHDNELTPCDAVPDLPAASR
jgi:hypothetical protein